MISDLYLKLKEQNIHIDVKDDNLDIKAPAGVLTKDIIDEIKRNKADLISFINQYKYDKASIIQKFAVSSDAKYPLSSSQLRLWILSQSEKGNVAYNSVGGYIFEGTLDHKALNEALNEVVLRHESLRTVFQEDLNGNVNQVVKEIEAIDFSIEHCDLQNTDHAEKILKEQIAKDSLIPFHLSKGPLFKTKLYQLEHNKWAFIYTIHHIIVDAVSMNIFIAEILEQYNSKKQNRASKLDVLRIQYKDYANWENQQLTGKKYEELKAYWLNQFTGELPVLTMPVDKKRPILQTFNGGTIEKKIELKLSEAIEKLIRDNGATMFMGLTTVINTLLYKFSTQEDIIIGTPVSGRENDDLQNQIGYYGNTLAMRMQFKKENTFFELLEYTKKQVLGAYEHQMFPFATLVKELQLKRDPSRNPLFDVQVIYGENDNHKKSKNLEGLKVWAYEFEEKLTTSRFDMVFSFYKEDNHLVVNIQYNTDVFSEKIVHQIADHVSVIMTSIVNNPYEQIYKLEHIAEQQKQQLLHISKGNFLSFNTEQTILDLFKEHVQKTPNAIALAFKDKKSTYKELEEESNRFANYLSANYDLKKNEFIGLMINNSENVLVCILGILKTGSAYVPIDPEYPKQRIQHIIQDTQLKVLITQSDYLFDLDFYSGEIFATDIQMDSLAAESTQFEAQVTPDTIAYIIYTSGSTGNAKGVVIDHENLMFSTIARLDTYPDVDAFLLLSSISFDSSIAGIFGTITGGGKLVFAPKIRVSDIDTIVDIIIEEEVSHLLTVPSYYQLLINELSERDNKLRNIIVAGEECTKLLVDLHQNTATLKNAKLFNEYGPTECTVWASYYVYEPTHEFIPSIGKAIANSAVYILNDNNELSVDGLIGEIHIAGKGLSSGYLNNPELSKEKFIDNPFEPGTKMYKTGDLAKRFSDGNIEFLGRKDNQIKIRGNRLELGEIENAILNFNGIDGAVVTYSEGNLTANLLTNVAINLEDLKKHLKQQLPVFALPGYYTISNEFPLLPNGKVDKKALLLLANEHSLNNDAYVAPTNEVEATLVNVFHEILQKENIGIKDDFFSLGGDSIKAIQIISKLKQKDFALTVQDIMQFANIQELALHVKLVKQEIDQNAVTGIISLTPIQKYFFEVTSQDQNHFNQSVLLKSSKPLSEEGLTQIFQKLIDHHDALRAVFKEEGNSWIQKIKNEGFEFKLNVHSNVNDAQFNTICDDYQSSFDLEKGPLFKAVLLKKENTDYLLLLSHHLVIDGVSWRIILEDLVTLYGQYEVGNELELPLKTHSLKYWQEKQLEYANSLTMIEEQVYWSSMDEKVRFSTSELPKDFDYQGNNLYKDFETKLFQLDHSTTEKLLTESHKAYKTNINDVLITALSLAIGKNFDVNDVTIQLEGHGREDINSEIDVTRTVGWFTTIYPVLIALKKNKDNMSQLIEVKETLHRIPNKGIGFGILKYLKECDFTIKADVSFNYLGDFDLGKSKKDEQIFQFTDEYKGKEIAVNIERTGTLDVSGILINDQLQIMLSFNTHYFKNETIENLKESYKKELEYLISCLSEEKETHLTPVDFTYKGLDISSLEELNKML
ncbi:non-ribosomal peptide synthase protein (TIGR01720 family)/amino acid adenylation domain-containing protein [Flavobacterium chryseum]|uniref:non-ribosomal peptide synthetase n=1 Tax=Flavobacterium sp. P3160 TaxID=2512113 RepID=UPI001061E714|nr:non-ribosomal peptide synthetase [Flavobacterium sp. P3160]TDO73432.1 non-ribosomal peptide synthase protein (TIGR01720 family)/amino acid adenylation domain-containing protein [Flavobacterium sp. P3160]